MADSRSVGVDFVLVALICQDASYADPLQRLDISHGQPRHRVKLVRELLDRARLIRIELEELASAFQRE